MQYGECDLNRGMCVIRQGVGGKKNSESIGQVSSQVLSH